MRVYIATTLSNAKRAEAVAHHLEDAGITPTYKWWSHGAVGHQGVGALVTVAQLELNGVRDADMVIVLLPGGRGTHTELGAALVLGKPVIIWDEPGGAFDVLDTSCSFHFHPLVHQMRGDLDVLSNMALLVHQASVVVEEHRAGTIGRGAFGHAAALLSKLAG